MAGSDVEKDQLVGTTFAVGASQFDGVASVTQVDKISALDGLSVLNVEAGYDSLG